MTMSKEATNSQGLAREKLRLLSLSKNLVLLAEAQNWKELEVAQVQWQRVLQQAVGQYSEQLEGIRPTLLSDLERLQQLLADSQKHLVAEFSNSIKVNKSIQKYVTT